MSQYITGMWIHDSEIANKNKRKWKFLSEITKCEVPKLGDFLLTSPEANPLPLTIQAQSTAPEEERERERRRGQILFSIPPGSDGTLLKAAIAGLQSQLRKLIFLE